MTFPFPTAILSFVHCCLQQPSHLVCEHVLNEAVFSQTPIPAAVDHLRKSSVSVALTELLSAASEARIRGGRWGDLSVFAPLKELSLLITGGA